MEIVVQCHVCAWRAECKKKYSIEADGGTVRCPDYSRDITLPKEDSADEE